jgi:hypothetical protein
MHPYSKHCRPAKTGKSGNRWRVNDRPCHYLGYSTTYPSLIAFLEIFSFTASYKLALIAGCPTIPVHANMNVEMTIIPTRRSFLYIVCSCHRSFMINLTETFSRHIAICRRNVAVIEP